MDFDRTLVYGVQVRAKLAHHLDGGRRFDGASTVHRASCVLFPLIARMSSIEVLKGSSQIAFGPQTAGGAINLVTTPLEDAASQLLYRSEISSYGGHLMHVRMVQQWSGKNGTWGAG